MANVKIAALRAEGMSKRQAKRQVYAHPSRRIAVPAPVALYHRLATAKRRAA